MAQEQDSIFSGVTAKSVAKYALLPGIFPRLQRMAGHFSQFLFMFTQIFGAVGLIDKNHPCLRPENIGRYRFVDVIGLAASNVVFDRKHLPQIVMFFVVVLSIVLTAAIVIGLIAGTIFTVHNAHAQFFGTPQSFTPGDGTNQVNYSATSDWALNFLFRIFGDTGFFPHPADGAVGNPWYTLILIGMLKYYSLAMLVIAAFMILYILVITLTESARTGQPFGSRFDGIWAPVRLALAIGLLMPVAHGGYNGAQMITFQSAVWGSNLATNVWYGGLATMGDKSKTFFTSMLGDPGYRFTRDMFLVNLCVEGLAKQSLTATNTSNEIHYTAVKDLTDGKVTYTFGPTTSPDFCGQVEILTSPDAAKPADLSGVYWPDKVTQGYFNIAKKFLPIPSSDMTTAKTTFGTASVDNTIMGPAVKYAVVNILGLDKTKQTKDGFVKIMNSAAPPFDAKTIESWIQVYWANMGVMYNCSADGPPYKVADPASCPGPAYKSLFFTSPDYEPAITAYNNWIINHMSADAKYGWTSAGSFYLRITSALAAVSEVVNNKPRVTKLPANFSKAFATIDLPSANTDIIKDQCMGFFTKIANFLFGNDTCSKYDQAIKVNTFLRAGKDWFLEAVKARDATKIYSELGTGDFDRALEFSEPESPTNMETANITGPVLGGLAGMAKIDSTNMNPLGTVVTWGNLLIVLSMLSYAIGLAGNGAAWTEIAFSIGGLLMIPGFVLAFWIPTIPFMHFTFAVIEWMISVLEAVIGMPLWALSMITLEGDGLGSLGMAGVKRLFEIILRPTIIIISLVGSVIIFTAGVSFFNSALGLYQDAHSQGTGFFTGLVGGVGMIFVYMFGIYTLATTCFKLIDQIPDKFGRWMGLEGGFGSQIKTGMSELSNLIVGGVALKQINDLGKQANSNAQKRRADAAKKRKDAMDK